MNQRERRDWRERRRIGELADEWRAIVRGVPPWEVIARDGDTVLWDTRENRQLGVLHGDWTPGIAGYLNAIDPYAGFVLAELLWNIGGHGNAAAIQRYALELLLRMGLGDDRARGSRERWCNDEYLHGHALSAVSPDWV